GRPLVVSVDREGRARVAEKSAIGRRRNGGDDCGHIDRVGPRSDVPPARPARQPKSSDARFD
ncbi:hypothetical protein KDW38_06900, partial [Burkholderia multivorans]|uniref:hypothetical protein n=1 Tax=Burkholderia multivorans TaxID=87883 RepID=UPI001B8F6ADC